MAPGIPMHYFVKNIHFIEDYWALPFNDGCGVTNDNKKHFI